MKERMRTYCENLMASAEATRLAIDSEMPAIQSHIHDARNQLNILRIGNDKRRFEGETCDDITEWLNITDNLRKARNQRSKQLVAVDAEIQALRNLLDSA